MTLKPLVVNHSFVTHPLPPLAQRAMEDWFVSKRDEVAEVLARYDLAPADVMLPQLLALVYVDVPDGKSSDTRKEEA